MIDHFGQPRPPLAGARREATYKRAFRHRTAGKFHPVSGLACSKDADILVTS